MFASSAISHAKVVSPPNLVLEDTTVVIKGNRIDYVGSGRASARVKRMIDGRNKALNPGLIVTHVHLTMGPDCPPATNTTIVG
jgi:imidazolonepropionase-like amidohydrolase